MLQVLAQEVKNRRSRDQELSVRALLNWFQKFQNGLGRDFDDLIITHKASETFPDF
jgi:hypothetical protein